MLKNLSLIVLILTSSINGLNLYAELQLPNIFSDNMVLQRNKTIAIWGEATAGEVVTVRFAGQSQTGTADTDDSLNYADKFKIDGGYLETAVEGA